MKPVTVGVAVLQRHSKGVIEGISVAVLFGHCRGSCMLQELF